MSRAGLVSNNSASRVACPYFAEHDHFKVRCEGLTKDNHLAIEWRAKRPCKEYMMTYCWSIENCNKCKVHQILDEKWQEKTRERGERHE